MEFLSGFEKTVYVAPQVEIGLATDDVLYDTVNGLTISQIAAIAGANSGSATQVRGSALRAVDSGGSTTYAFDSSSAATLQGVLYEYNDGKGMAQTFIPGTFVEGVFHTTPGISVIDDLAIAGTFVHLDSYQIEKTYFDFWFPEFKPYVPSDPGLSAAEKAAEALEQWLPPQYLYDEALQSYTDLIPDRFLNADDELAWSDDEAADYADIKNDGFTHGGAYNDAG